MQKLFKLSMAALLSGGAVLSAADFSACKLEEYSSYTKGCCFPSATGFMVKQPKGKGSVSLYGAKKFAVSPAKKYCATVEFRLPEGCTESGTFYIALVCYDKNGVECKVTEVNGRPGTQTVLTAPVKVGDKVIRIKDGSKWVNRYAHAAFNAKADYSDLPNRELSPRAVKIEKAGNEWVLTLNAPMKKAYPAGTAVRNHADGCTYRYVVGKAPTAAWQTYNLKLQGVARSDQDSGAYGKFRAGTAQVGFYIFAYEGNKPFNAEFRKVEISEIK